MPRFAFRLPRRNATPLPENPLVAFAWRGVHLRGREWGSHLLEDVTLDLYPGEVHLLLGERGAGKTLLLELAIGERRPDTGHLLLSDTPYTPRHPADASAARLTVIRRQPRLLESLTVEENLLLAHPAGPLEGPGNALALLPPGVDLARQSRVADLPPDQRQWVAILRAIHPRPRVVIFEEPALPLPSAQQRHLLHLFECLTRHGTAILYSTRAFPDFPDLPVRRFTLLHEGRVERFGLMNTATALPGSLPWQRRLPPRRHFKAPDDALMRQPLLTLRESGRVAPARLVLHEGEICGLAGRAGSGRHALLQTIAGLRRDPHWEVWKTGEPVGLFENAGERLMSDLPILENLTLPRLEATCGFITNLRREKITRDWMAKLGLNVTNPHTPVAELSLRDQRRVALGRLLIARRRLLLFHEPEEGLPPAERHWLLSWLQELAHSGHGILLAGAAPDELLALCDTVAVMEGGHLQSVRPAAQWTENELPESR